MKTAAFGMALAIMTIAAIGIVMPSGLVWIAQRSASSNAFYLIASVRIAFGLVLIAAASASRAPRALAVLGYFILIAGIATALTGLFAIDRASALIDWWLQQGAAVVRLTAAVVLALGGFIAYACAPGRARRSA